MAYPFAAAEVLTAVDLNAMIGAPTQNAITTVTYTAVLLDAGKTVTLSNASAVTLTIPAQASVSWADNTQLNFLNIGAGTVTITPAADVTINGTPLTLATSKGGSLVRTASNVWTFIPFSSGPDAPGSLQYLAIAGGGGGGNGVSATTNGGGGGAGGYFNSMVGETTGGGGVALQPIPIAAGITYTITIGAGGPNNTSGSDTTITGSGLTTITAVGGGRGGSTLNQTGFTGGSGGGGTTGGAGTTPAGGAATANPVQGFAGGAGASGTGGGGGGGAGGAGVAGNTCTGGAGLSSSITGSSVARGGGGGGSSVTGGTATAGGGAGANAGSAGANGTENTGGGGGGGSGTTPGYNGGFGGRGVVIFRHPDTIRTATTLTGGTVATSGGFRVYTFNDTGTIGWS